jgi:hypothetical protein
MLRTTGLDYKNYYLMSIVFENASIVLLTFFTLNFSFIIRSGNEINDNNVNLTSSNADVSKQAGFFSGLFANNNDPNSHLERDPEMEIGPNLANPFSNSDHVSYLAEGSNNYEQFIDAPTPTPNYAQQVKLLLTLTQ